MPKPFYPTRSLEFAMSIHNIVWSVFFALSDTPYIATAPSVIDTLNRFGGPRLWSALFLSSGVFKLFALWYQYPRFRAWGAALSTFAWTAAAYAFLRSDPRLFAGYLSVLYAFASAYTTSRRTALLHRDLEFQALSKVIA